MHHFFKTVPATVLLFLALSVSLPAAAFNQVCLQRDDGAIMILGFSEANFDVHGEVEYNIPGHRGALTGTSNLRGTVYEVGLTENVPFNRGGFTHPTYTLWLEIDFTTNTGTFEVYSPDLVINHSGTLSRFPCGAKNQRNAVIDGGKAAELL